MAQFATSKSLKQQPRNVQVDKECRVAEFDPKVVQEELAKRQPNPLRQLLSFKNMKVNIIGKTWYFLLIFLLLYYGIQTAYQLDLFCEMDDDDIEDKELCRNRTRTFFKHWDEHESTMTRLITFLLGFYVSMIGKRWWNQVSKLPDVDTLSLALGGLVWAKTEPGPTSPEAALHLKKTIIRYALLSWTMCFSRISSPLRKRFLTAQHYIDRNLLTRSEADALKINANHPDCTSRWWIPLSWSISMINEAFNSKEALIPKDHNKLVTAIINLRNDLYNVADYRLKPLPAIYKQAVWVAVVGWMLLGIVANQNSIHHEDDGANTLMTILLSFPLHGLLMYMLIFGWLKVADILSNPFGNDKVFDINLASTLDLNIWKSSITLENQGKAVNSNFLMSPYQIDEPRNKEEKDQTNNISNQDQIYFSSENIDKKKTGQKN